HSGVSAAAVSPTGPCNAVVTSDPPPAGYDGVVYTQGCGSVAVVAGGELEAKILGPFPGPSDNKAYATIDFGGASGLAGSVVTHDHLRVEAGATPTGNLPVLDVYDLNGSLVYELYLDSARVLHLWSPPGGLHA